MKNWKKAIALVASAAALVSVAACGPSNAGGSSDSGKKTVGFVADGRGAAPRRTVGRRGRRPASRTRKKGHATRRGWEWCTPLPPM